MRNEEEPAEYLADWNEMERILRERMELEKKYGNVEEDKEEFKRLKRKIVTAVDKMASLPPCDRGIFRRYALWAKTLHMKILDFKEERRIYPNIMLASRLTYDKMDISLESAENLVLETRDEESFEEYGDFDFIDGDCALHFCVDETLKKGEFRLVHDSAPDFGGEESGYTRLNAA